MWALAAALALAGCAGGRPRRLAFEGSDGRARVALFPLENLSGASVPAKALMLDLELAAARAGLEVVSGVAVDEFLARHRLRYTGGVDGEAAVAARDELGVDGIIVTSVGLYEESQPPRIAMTMRLVAAAEDPSILWIDSAAAAGDDSPGLFGLGIETSVKTLERDAVAKLARSLVRFVETRAPAGAPCPGGGRFEPQIAFRSRTLQEPRTFSIAVLPFVDKDARRNAGQAVALEFVRHLSSVESLRVLEPGVVRRVILGTRVIQEGGVSLDHVRLITDILDVDLVLAGTVRDYQEGDVPRVEFNAVMIYRRGRQVVWESTSRNRGDDAVTLFGAGRIRTASALTCRMVRTVVDRMVGETRGQRRHQANVGS